MTSCEEGRHCDEFPVKDSNVTSSPVALATTSPTSVPSASVPMLPSIPLPPTAGTPVTTVAPTTTNEPTTGVPTTAAPTTKAPTTTAPTSSPSTSEPTNEPTAAPVTGAPTTTPTTTAPTAPPTTAAPTPVPPCTSDETGSFGTGGSEQPVAFEYKLNSNLTVDDTLATLEKALADVQVETLFDNCRRRRRLQVEGSDVTGFLSTPMDSLMQECESEQPNFSCYIMKGEYTLLGNEGADLSDDAALSLGVTEAAMREGFLNTDNYNVEYLGSNQTDTTRSPSDSDDRVLPIWASVIIALGGASLLLCAIVGLLLRRRNQETDQAAADLDPVFESTSPTQKQVVDATEEPEPDTVSPLASLDNSKASVDAPDTSGEAAMPQVEEVSDPPSSSDDDDDDDDSGDIETVSYV